jgi:hypothetical protein
VDTPFGRGRPAASEHASQSFVIAVIVCLFVTWTFLLISDAFRHWFVFPVFAAGVLIVADVVDWARGKVGLFDPIGLVGIVGTLHFFLAPLLHVYWDHWIAYVAYPPDWRDWLGWMALLNVAGLIVYRMTRGPRSLPQTLRPPKTTWMLDRRRFTTALAVAIPVAAAFSLWIYVSFGGLSGYVDVYVRERQAFSGAGWMFMFADSLPILLLFAYVLVATVRRGARSWFVVGAVLLTVFALRFGFGALRGSRSTLVWALIWAVGVVHIWVRPLTRKLIAAGIVGVLLLIYLLGFYKGVGAEALTAFEGSRRRAQLEAETRNDISNVLLIDLGRSSIQSYLLYRLSNVDEYDYGWGRTYAAGLAVVVPRAVWPNRPVLKVKEGTEALYGRGRFAPVVQEATFVYGLAGEAMLNFGPWAVPVAFGLFGLLVRAIRRFELRLPRGDVRRLVYPFLSVLCLVVLLSDSDNVTVFLLQNGLLPFAVLYAGSTKVFRGPRGRGRRAPA